MWIRFRWLGPGVCSYHGQELGHPGDIVTTRLVTQQWVDEQIRLGQAARV